MFGEWTFLYDRCSFKASNHSLQFHKFIVLWRQINFTTIFHRESTTTTTITITITTTHDNNNNNNNNSNSFQALQSGFKRTNWNKPRSYLNWCGAIFNNLGNSFGVLFDKITDTKTQNDRIARKDHAHAFWGLNHSPDTIRRFYEIL